MSSVRVVFALLVASRVSAGQDSVPLERRGATIGLDAAIRQTGSFDQTLSPLRYSGTGSAARVSLAVPRRRMQFDADLELSASTATTEAGSVARPSLHTVVAAAHLGLSKQVRSGVAGWSIAPGLGLAGRVATREHHFTRSQTYGRFDSAIADSFDRVIALQGLARATRDRATGDRLSVAAAVSAFGIASHPYYPTRATSRAPWITSRLPGFLLAGAECDYMHPVSPHVALGIRYALRVFRARGASDASEVSHQLGLTMTLRAGRP
jgi:hypothetical protein